MSPSPGKPRVGRRAGALRWIGAGSWLVGLVLAIIVVLTEDSGKALMYSLSGLAMLSLLGWFAVSLSTARPRVVQLRAKAALVLLSLCFSVGLGEVGLRSFARRMRGLIPESRLENAPSAGWHVRNGLSRNSG